MQTSIARPAIVVVCCELLGVRRIAIVNVKKIQLLGIIPVHPFSTRFQTQAVSLQ